MYLGTSAFRKDTLISHWKSVFHKRCEDKKKLETKSKADDSTASSSASGPLVVSLQMYHMLVFFTTNFFNINMDIPK
jgi:hypothetical protein